MKKLFLLFVTVLLTATYALAQNRTIHGTVIAAEDNEPLIGATVMPVGGGQGTATDFDGNFTLSIPASVSQLTVSYVGMTTKTVPATDGQTIILDNADNRLDEVVVTGYGSGKKLGSIVGSVAVVGDKALENITTPSFIDALQGQVAGLSIMSGSGDPSSTDTDIRLRGVNSVSASTEPLFILDGAPITSTVFTTLNPNDIESITVLKDAASVAIYGSRAANGVIVITSKKGKFGSKAHVNISAKYGWSQRVADKVDMMGSADYIKFREMINQPVNQGAYDAFYKYGIDTDWQKEVFQTAPTYALEASVSGGGDNLSYYMSVNHMEQEGIIEQSGMRRETMRIAINAKANEWLRVGMQANLGYTKYETNNEAEAAASAVYITNPMVYARKALPMDSPYYYSIDENGKPVFGDRAKYLHYSGQLTPYFYNSSREVWRERVTGNLSIYEQINPIKGLTIRAQQAMDAYDTTLKNYGFYVNETTPMGDIFDASYEDGEMFASWSQRAFTRYYSFTYTNTAEYKFDIDNTHNFGALFGEESIISKSTNFGVYTEGQTDERLYLMNQGTSVNISDISDSYVRQTFNSIFLNLNYDYDNRYFLDFTYRRDGSSKFAPGHRWANFYSGGIMWNMKNEKFLQPVTWLDQLQARISYGTTGNAGIGNYAYLGLIGAGGLYAGKPSLGIAQAESVDLSWETVRSFDFGISGAIFNNLITVDADFYVKNTVDMLLTIPFSYTTGISGNLGNVGSMRNMGIDFTLNANVIRTQDWYWGLRANFNYNKNTITKLYDDQDDLTFPNALVQYKKGHSAGELYMVRWAGIDPRDGKTMWYDKNGNLTKTYNQEEDAVLTGKSQYSPWSGGFGTDLRWKDLSLKVDFAFALGKYMINNDRYFMENPNMALDFNQSVDMLNIWTPDNRYTDIAAAGEVIQFDTHLLENASFCRLKNLTLQYNLPRKWMDAARLDNVRLHFTGRNLLTFTNYTGYDPEPETNLIKFAYPNTRQYEFGIEVSF